MLLAASCWLPILRITIALTAYACTKFTHRSQTITHTNDNPDSNQTADYPRFAVTGAAGMLGTDLVAELHRRGFQVKQLNHATCDVTSAESCEIALRNSHADIVINCAAFTDVNGAESREDDAMAVNAAGAENLAAACAKTGARLVHVSTDYVFDGAGTSPYETDDPVNPLNAYGRTKLAGEQKIAAALPPGQWAIVRTSWLYGVHGPNFVKTMLRLGRDKKDLKIINDQIGAPTYTVDLAVALVDLALANASGIIHATGGGECTWFEFAREIFTLSGVEPASVAPCRSEDFPTPAVRPANSRLSPNSLLRYASPLPHWRDALRRYLAETGELHP